MNFQIGRVTEYDGYSGYILTTDCLYTFLEKDVKNEIKKGDYVLFRAEGIGGIKRAFFISFFTRDINEIYNTKIKLERLLRKDGESL